MGRKFIDELGIKHEKTPQGWANHDLIRRRKWEIQREKWGFDERETWDLSYSFILWLYERLKVYNEINIVDTEAVSYVFKGKIITFQECIERMLKGCEIYLTKDTYRTEEDIKKIDETLKLFTLCFYDLWW